MDKYSYAKDDKPQINPNMSLNEYLRTYYEKIFNEIMTIKGFMGSKTPIEFWGWLFEQPSNREVREMKGGNLKWPYADRIALCAMRFINLCQDEQEYIIKARKENIYWRRDSFDMFKRIAKETFRYFQLSPEQKHEYRKSTLKQVTRIVEKRTRID